MAKTAATLTKPTSKKAQANGKRIASVSSDESSESPSEESDNSEESDSSEEASPPVKSTVPSVKEIAKSSNDSSDASSSEDSSSEDSDTSNTEKIPMKPTPTVQKAGGSSADSSDSSSEDSDDDQEMTSIPAKTLPNKMSEPALTIPAEADKKRKADSETASVPKKAKFTNGSANAATSAEETKCIFVGRLSWNVDNDWLAQEFAECGEVESAHVQMDRNTGRSRGFGYVHFKTTNAVEKALAMNGKEIDGRSVNIDKSTPPDKKASFEKRAQAFGDVSSPPTAVLFVGNLSFGVNEDMLWETFGEHGDIKSVRVPTDRDTGKPKGFAYVEYSEIGSAKTAHGALQGFELDGRSLRLDFSQPRDSAGGRGGAQGSRGGRGRGGFNSDRGRGGFGGDRGRGGFGGDRGRGGFGGDRGRGFGRGSHGGHGGDRGGRARGRGARTGGIAQFEGQKITFS